MKNKGLNHLSPKNRTYKNSNPKIKKAFISKKSKNYIIMESEAQISYPIDFLRQLSLQFPLKEIAILAKVKRYATWMRLKSKIEEIQRENKQEILNLYDSIINISKNEVYDVTPTMEDITKIKQQIANINEKFKDINKFYDSCTSIEKKRLLLPFLGQESSEFKKYMNTFFQKLDSKIMWDKNDSLVYTYYKLYLELIDASYLKLYSETGDKIESTINQITSLLFFYKPILIAYVSNKLDDKVLIRRLAELRVNLRPRILPKINDKIKELFKIPPIQENI